MTAFFTELFRISPTDVESLLDPELERNPETSLWLRSLGDLELVALWESLPNADSTGTLIDDVLSDPEAGGLVFSLPSNFVDCMAAVRDQDIDKIAKKWSKMDEMADWKIADLAQVIRDIRAIILAAQANQQIVVQLAEI